MEANGYRNVSVWKCSGWGCRWCWRNTDWIREAPYQTGDTDQPDTERGKYGDWLPKCDDPATTWPSWLIDRHLPVFFLSLNSPQVNNPRSSFTVYSPVITLKLKEKNEGEQCEQSNQKKTFFFLSDFRRRINHRYESHRQNAGGEESMFTLHPLFTTYHSEIKGENRRWTVWTVLPKKKLFSYF